MLSPGVTIGSDPRTGGGAGRGPSCDAAARLDTRARATALVARIAGHTARTLGFGGQVLPGRVALRMRPSLLTELSAGRRVAVVSGTNGKTTTTALLAAALRRVGPVASNASGANMLDGVAAALLADPARLVAAEVDEQYLPAAVDRARPAVVVLLNLSRDQLDRVGETRRTAERWRATLAGPPGAAATVVANSDDPLIAWVARDHPRAVWVAAGAGWDTERGRCPDCAHPLRTDAGRGWWCGHCGAARPASAWAVAPRGGGATLTGPDGATWPLRLRLPPAVNAGNAALAVAAAAELGVRAPQALDAAREVVQVAGRYATFVAGAHRIWLLLAKNPAGWIATLEMLRGRPGPVVVAVNAGEADGRDTSWLYDVPFQALAGRRVIVAGGRADDVAVRLTYADVPHETRHDGPLAGLASLPGGPVTIIGDYTSFRSAYRALRGPAAVTRAA